MSGLGRPARILWNRRPTGRDVGCIDEIVLTGVDMVHVEQMDDRCWWIGITLADGTSWDGNFTADSKGRMRFFRAGIVDRVGAGRLARGGRAMTVTDAPSAPVGQRAPCRGRRPSYLIAA